VSRRLLYLVTEDWYFCMHWMRFAVAARAVGYRITVATRVNQHAAQITGAGLGLEPITLVRSSTNPLRDAGSIREIASLYRRLQPDIVHHIALKPVLYGSVAARIARVPCVINTVAGLGYVFSSEDLRAGLLRPLVRIGYRAALAPRRHHLTVQNRDDLAFLVKHAGAGRERSHVILGVGVDVNRFTPSPEPPGAPLVLLPARLLRDKGVGEFVAAARMLRERGVEARFAIAGGEDRENPAAIAPSTLAHWRKEGVVEFWGFQPDMPLVLAKAAIVCLPSYQEGLPTALTEAAACARPVVTCDVRGCREVVSDEDNGLLVPARDPAALARALERLILDPQLRSRMGGRGRERAVREFSLEHVIAETVALYRKLVPVSPPKAVETGEVECG
jgi:glycosyltransferase involved in cell wall biosynthesis